MSALRNRPPLMPDETLLSHVSRTARCYGADLATLCHELGLSRRGLATGREDAVGEYSRLAGMSPAVLSASAFRRDAGLWWYGGQALHRLGVRRLALSACARCLAEDVAASGLRADRAVYFRAQWMAKSVRTCDRHDVELSGLVEVEAAVGPEIHDLAGRLAPFVSDLDRLAADARERKPTPLESYVIGRMRGGQVDGGFVDQMPLFAAARTCEMLGAAALFGPKTIVRSLDADAWRAAGAVGFEVASLGVEAVRSCLLGMMENHGVATRNLGAHKVFSLLHIWLKTKESGPHYEPFRAVLREVIFDTIPLAAGTEVLGVKLDRRRLHSLHSAVVETGRGMKGLRRELRSAGVLPFADGKGPGRLVVIPVEKTAEALADMARSLPRAEAAAYIGAEVADIKRLTKERLIVPLVPKPDVERSHVRFSTRVLDAFLHGLARGVTNVVREGADMGDIPTIAKRTTRGLVAVTALVMDGRLRHVARRPGCEGFRSVLVDFDEVLGVPLVTDEAGSTIEEVAAKLRITRVSALDLVRTGSLRAREVPSPVSKRTVTVVENASLENFASEFASLHELSSRLGVGWSLLKKRLDARGITPAFPIGRQRSVIYRRKYVTEDAHLPSRE